MKVNNLFRSHDAFKVAVTTNREIVARGEAELGDGTLVITGNCRKGVSLRVSRISGKHLEDIGKLSLQTQLLVLETVKSALSRIGAALVLFYEAAWRRASIKTALKAYDRVQTLPQQLHAQQRRTAANETAYRLGARASVLVAA